MNQFSELKIHLTQYNLNLSAKSWHNESNKIPCLALHGWLDNAGSFDPLAPLLKKHKILALDWAGHGFSDHLPASQIYDMYSYACHALAVAEYFKWQKFNLIAHSLGACTAILIAGMFPERIHSLILIEGLGPESSKDEKAPELFSKSFLRSQKARTDLTVYKNTDQAAKVRSMNSNVNKESALILAKRSLIQIKNGVTWRSDPRLFLPSPHPLTEKQIEAFLKNITCPSVLFLADKGWDFDQIKHESRKKCIQQLKTFSINGSHHIHMEEPHKIKEIITELDILN